MREEKEEEADKSVPNLRICNRKSIHKEELIGLAYTLK